MAFSYLAVDVRDQLRNLAAKRRVDVLIDLVYARQLHLNLRENGVLFWSFPCVCPEPVLVK